MCASQICEPGASQICEPGASEVCEPLRCVSQCVLFIVQCVYLGTKRKKEDTFGQNDDDWNIYKEIVSSMHNFHLLSTFFEIIYNALRQPAAGVINKMYTNA